MTLPHRYVVFVCGMCVVCVCMAYLWVIVCCVLYVCRMLPQCVVYVCVLHHVWCVLCVYGISMLSVCLVHVCCVYVWCVCVGW